MTFLPPKVGNRAIDFDTEGIAHYGLLPEWLDQLREIDEQDPADLMEILMTSAEAYVAMWERAEGTAAAR